MLLIKENLRKENLSLSIVWRFPDKSRLSFITIISLRDSRTLGQRFHVGNIHKLSHPLLIFGIARLEEETTEKLSTGHSH